jgi:hypothetical protein
MNMTADLNRKDGVRAIFLAMWNAKAELAEISQVLG